MNVLALAQRKEDFFQWVTFVDPGRKFISIQQGVPVELKEAISEITNAISGEEVDPTLSLFRELQPPLLIALALAPLARAQRLYGPGFVITLQQQGTPPNPQLERLPAWQVRTATGLIYGYIDSPRGPNSADKRTIGTISAGLIPNTPCRAHPTTSNTR